MRCGAIIFCSSVKVEIINVNFVAGPAVHEEQQGGAAQPRLPPAAGCQGQPAEEGQVRDRDLVTGDR